MIFEFVKSAGEKMMNFFTNENSNDEKATKINEFVNKLGFEATNFSVTVNDDVATLCGECADAGIKEKMIVAVGNVEGIAKVEDKMTVTAGVTDAPVFYTVKSGDTLSKISKNYYGDPMKYNAIFEANTPMLSHPDKIYPGQTLRIPGGNTTVA